MKKLILYILFTWLSTITAMATDYTFVANKGVTCQWTAGDMACAYGSVGSAIVESVVSVDADAHYATFSNDSWALAANNSYLIYYPFNSQYIINSNTPDALPVSYKAQNQAANNSTQHLKAYDYMVAHCTTTATDAEFSMQHFGAILCIEWKAKETMTASSITLSTTDELFTNDAEMNLETKTLIAKKKSKSITLTLDDIAIKEGESLRAYMMIAPTNLNAMDVELCINTKEGTQLVKHLKGATILPGKCYPISVDATTETIANAKSIVTQVSATSTLKKPQGTLSDFMIDTDNAFEPINPTSINKLMGIDKASHHTFLIDGRRTNDNQSKQINIANGKKYIKQ